MLRKGLYGVLAVSLLIVSAQSAEAQFPSLLRFNVNGGAAMPMSEAGDAWEAGFRVGAGLELRAPLIPLGLRVDGAYDRMAVKGGGDGNLSILSGTANGVFSMPLLPVYAIGGIGMYRMDAGAGTSTEFGFNVGAGFALPLPMLSPFVEARFHQINGDGGNFRYLPVVAGIRF
jgi:hypothetical protein